MTETQLETAQVIEAVVAGTTEILHELQASMLKTREARGACVNDTHRHWTFHLVDGTCVDEPVAFGCWGHESDGSLCGRPAHLDLTTDTYRHDDPDAPACDMTDGKPVTPCRPPVSLTKITEVQ